MKKNKMKKNKKNEKKKVMPSYPALNGRHEAF